VTVKYQIEKQQLLCDVRLDFFGIGFGVLSDECCGHILMAFFWLAADVCITQWHS
jgi:hypothetical protein